MILLDTHTLIWYLTEPSKLSPKALQIIEDNLDSCPIYLSSITIWEICQLFHKKRVNFSQSLSKTLETIYSMDELDFIPIDNKIAELSQILPGTFHRDPADRFIVATARSLGATLITKDQKIHDYKHVKTLW